MPLLPFSTGLPIPVPIKFGGTGSVTATGSGSTVLQTSPTLTGTPVINGDLVPNTNNSRLLGHGSLYWNGAYITTLNLNSTASLSGGTAGKIGVTGILTSNLNTFNNNAVTVTTNAGTCSASSYLNTFTNSSAATMAITLSTTGAVDGQRMMVRIYDFSAVAQTIGWTNTENSSVSVPTTSNGSTSLPLTVGFIYNGSTSKWRCVAVA